MAFLIDNKMWADIKKTREDSMALLRKMGLKSVTNDQVLLFLMDANAMLENATVKLSISQKHALGTEAFFEDFIATIKILIKVAVSCKFYRVNLKQYCGSNRIKTMCKELKTRVQECNVNIGLGIDIKETIRISSDPNGNSGVSAVLGGRTDVVLTGGGSVTTHSISQTDHTTGATINHQQQITAPKPRSALPVGTTVTNSTVVSPNDGYTPSYLTATSTTSTPYGNVSSTHTAMQQPGLPMATNVGNVTTTTVIPTASPIYPNTPGSRMSSYQLLFQ